MLPIGDARTQRGPALAGPSSGGTIEGEHRICRTGRRLGNWRRRYARDVMAITKMRFFAECCRRSVAEDARRHDRAFSESGCQSGSRYLALVPKAISLL